MMEVVQHSPDGDHALLCAWRAGDRRAADRFVRRFTPALARFFRNKLACAADCADLVQDTFLALQRTHASAGPGAAPASVRAYVFAIARRVLCAHLRKKYKRDSEALDFSAVCVKDLEPASLSALLMRRREHRAFVEALRMIPLFDQLLLEAKYFDAMSVREIADMLGQSASAVPGGLQRAKKKLREQVEVALSQLHGGPVPGPSDDELDRWAQEIRAQLP